ncbi:potassium-transporting ATPase subunit B, partial [Xanthomonas oryzae pv. oryzae]
MSTIDTTEKRERGDAALFDAAVLVAAMRAAFGKLAPRHLLRSPVMAVVMGGTVLAAVITASGHAHAGFGWAVT